MIGKSKIQRMYQLCKITFLVYFFINEQNSIQYLRALTHRTLKFEDIRLTRRQQF
jgi:hypothetical protein